jgi:hypothetical protein
MEGEEKQMREKGEEQELRAAVFPFLPVNIEDTLPLVEEHPTSMQTIESNTRARSPRLGFWCSLRPGCHGCQLVYQLPCGVG